MGDVTRLIVFVSILAATTLNSEAQYLLPITKHEPTKQFYTTINIGSAAKSPVNLLLDLGTNLTWLDCRKIKSLSSLRLVTCQSSTCKSIPGNGCDGKSCLYRQPNPLGKIPVVTGRVVQDSASISTTDGGKFLSKVSVRPFTFSCAEEKHFQGLSFPVAGVMALSPGKFPFWRQVTTAFNVIPKFSLCLPSSGTGHFYIAGVHYLIPPFNGPSGHPIPMTLTPLKNIDSGNYIISVTSIYVDGIPLSLKPNLLDGGAKLSTVVPYTVVHTDIYNALAYSFTLKAKAMGLYEAGRSGPFKDCFDLGGTDRAGAGLQVPVIEFGLPGRAGEVKWKFHGKNTVVYVMETVVCLAFVDGGKRPNDLMLIGTHQLQDYMVEFDFSTTLLAFSDSLLLHNTSCSSWPSHK
uniref:Basic 7S globulin 2 n=1 Tax=Noccaea caerulescens TaxID=107243 RepID=A0A1J3IW46_NOCCA